MASSIKLVTANLWAGGIGRSRTESRLLKLLDLLAAQHASVIAAQECLYWHENDFELFHMTELALGMRGVIGVEDTGMCTALFVAPPLTLTRSRVIAGGPERLWRHGAVRAEVAFPDGETMTLGSVHLSPRSRTQRLLEGEAVTTWWKPEDLTAVLGDFNTPDYDTDLTSASEYIREELMIDGTDEVDTRAMDHIIRRGFIDLAARDEATRVPTAGHGREVRTRCDRMFVSPKMAERCGSVTLIDTCGLSDHDWAAVTYFHPGPGAR